MTHILETALAETKSTFLTWTRMNAKARAGRVAGHLLGMSLDQVAPVSNRYIPRGHPDYGANQKAHDTRQLYLPFTEIIRDTENPYAVADRKFTEAGRDAWIEQNVRNAESSFDAYVCKLITKTDRKGVKITDAQVSGLNIWEHSVLSVAYEDGQVDRWKTQCIVNYSVYGKAFNQFPTRKIK